MDTVLDNSMELRWPERFNPVRHPPDVVLDQVHAGLATGITQIMYSNYMAAPKNASLA